MKQLALANGDLVLDAGRGHKVITGSARIRQDLHLALGEKYGNDRFHRSWGSVLIDYLGQTITPELELLVQSEVNRVVNGYIAVQRQQVLTDNLNLRRSRFDTSDVVRQVESINAVVDLDSIKVILRLRTQADEQITVVRQVSL